MEAKAQPQPQTGESDTVDAEFKETV
jgi:hypothetical protein